MVLSYVQQMQTILKNSIQSKALDKCMHSYSEHIKKKQIKNSGNKPISKVIREAKLVRGSRCFWE